MNHVQNPASLKSATVYNAAADHFDAEPLAFWSRHGQKTIDLLSLRAGDSVLDVGCGTGTSALPAAETVGAEGRVVAIDVADRMLAQARSKAEKRGLANIDFRLADMATTPFENDSFDAVVSVFSFFFVPDMEKQVARLWDLVRPGGKLALTVWEIGAFEPLASAFAAEARRFRPDLLDAKRPWERLTDTMALTALLRDAGTAPPEIHMILDSQPVRVPEDWWAMVNGTGYRWEADQLTADQRETVRTRMVERLTLANSTAMCANAMVAICRKPPR
jgi:ubiquinone/menaquinone biosynthesis C-methylase UbiE